MCRPIYLYSLHGYCRDPVNVFEGQEKQAFWDAIGGKCEYHSDKRLQVCYIVALIPQAIIMPKPSSGYNITPSVGMSVYPSICLYPKQ